MATTQPFRLLDFDFSVEIEGSDALVQALLEPLRAKAGNRSAPTFHLKLPTSADGDTTESGVLTTVRSATTSNRPMGLLQQLVAEVLAEAVPDDLPCLSGALLDVEGRGLLLVGAPGSGVSTMVVATLRAGAALVSEQVVVLGEHGARPLPLPIMLTKGSMELLDIAVPDDCGCGKYAHPVAHFGRVELMVPPVAVVAVIDPEVSSLEPTSRARAMTAILRQHAGQALDAPGAAHRLATLLGPARCFLTSHDLGSVPKLLAASALQPSPVQVVTEEIDGGTITFLDGEAVALVDGLVHHLDPTATGLWILATEGLSAAEIGDELGASEADVARGLGNLKDAGVPL